MFRAAVGVKRRLELPIYEAWGGRIMQKVCWDRVGTTRRWAVVTVTQWRLHKGILQSQAKLGPGLGAHRAQEECPVINIDYLLGSFKHAVHAVQLTGVFGGPGVCHICLI